jgi:uncharacterized protein YkwD
MGKKKHKRKSILKSLSKKLRPLLKLLHAISSLFYAILELASLLNFKSLHLSSILHGAAQLRERKRSRQLKFVNRYRKKHGLPSLKGYYELDRIAKGHSQYMAKNKTCDHAGIDHRVAKVRQLTGSGYVAENCFKYPAKRYNKRVAKELVKGWMKSPGHRENLLNSKFRKIGIGVVTKKGYVYATQIFAD